LLINIYEAKIWYVLFRIGVKIESHPYKEEWDSNRTGGLMGLEALGARASGLTLFLSLTLPQFEKRE